MSGRVIFDTRADDWLGPEMPAGAPNVRPAQFNAIHLPNGHE
jgi:hypothetical protein